MRFSAMFASLLATGALVVAAPIEEVDEVFHYCGTVSYLGGGFEYMMSKSCQRIPTGKTIASYKIWEGCTCFIGEKCTGTYTGWYGPAEGDRMQSWNLITYVCIDHRHATENEHLPGILSNGPPAAIIAARSPALAGTEAKSTLKCGTIGFEDDSSSDMVGNIGCQMMGKVVASYTIVQGCICVFYNETDCKSEFTRSNSHENENLVGQNMRGYTCMDNPQLEGGTFKGDPAALSTNEVQVNRTELVTPEIHNDHVNDISVTVTGSDNIVQARGCGTIVLSDRSGQTMVEGEYICHRFYQEIKGYMISQECTCTFYFEACDATEGWAAWNGPAQGTLSGMHGYKCNAGQAPRQKAAAGDMWVELD
ncbi:hypothetical protein K505DRAFT_357420 [Melanomma pulvis-pyrius CBS 109.77]|uniref:Uncharacterized protein n=1 Tax=Melanomma pulvis-pyrius CBS 109.77 TaxID=1314802 RepID=A0A6A6XPU3_9PLEO|nr:hypothetical protein K505DRAFT_357420 [Melanomma pulvis-pyrius CBS 109.77]